MSGNYISLLFIQATNLVLPIVTYPFLIRILGLDRFGLIMFAQAICGVVLVFVDYGFSLSATRRIALLKNEGKDLSTIFWTVFVIKISIALLLFIIYYSCVQLIPRFALEKEVFLLSYLIVIGQTLSVDWFFQGIEKMKLMALISLLAKGLFTAFIFMYISKSLDYIKVPLLMGLGFIIAGLLSVFISLKYIQFRTPSLLLARELIIESFNLFISNFAAKLINTIPVLVLGLFVSDFTVGIYTSMEKLITTVKGVFVSLYQAVYPWLSVQSASIQLKYVKKMTLIIGILGILAMIPFFLFGGWLLDVLYDSTAINNHIHLFYMLTINILFSGYYMLFIAHYFPAIGDFISRLKVLVISSIIGVLIALITISQFHLIGAVITSISVEFFLMLFSVYYFSKQQSLKKLYS